MTVAILGRVQAISIPPVLRYTDESNIIIPVTTHCQACIQVDHNHSRVVRKVSAVKGLKFGIEFCNYIFRINTAIANR